MLRSYEGSPLLRMLEGVVLLVCKAEIWILIETFWLNSLLDSPCLWIASNFGSLLQSR